MSPQSCRSEVQRLFSFRLLIGCVSVSSIGLGWDSDLLRCLLILSLMTSLAWGMLRSAWSVWFVTYQVRTFAEIQTFNKTPWLELINMHSVVPGGEEFTMLWSTNVVCYELRSNNFSNFTIKISKSMVRPSECYFARMTPTFRNVSEQLGITWDTNKPLNELRVYAVRYTGDVWMPSVFSQSITDGSSKPFYMR